MPSIIQGWVQELGLRHQGVLVSAVRGCDTLPKENPAKTLSRFLRGSILVPHDYFTGRRRTVHDAYMALPDIQIWDDTVKGFFKEDWDVLPLHYTLHLAHAAEILGYCYPLTQHYMCGGHFHANSDMMVHEPLLRDAWLKLYQKLCNKMHMLPETKTQLDARLDADEATFKAAQ